MLSGGEAVLGVLHVEEDACCFSHAFSQPSRASMFEVKLSLRDWLRGNDVSRIMLLDSFGGTNLHCATSRQGHHSKMRFCLQSLVCKRSMFAISSVMLSFCNFKKGD
jgi:hypothetical protein